MFKNLSRYLHYIHLSEIQQTYSPRRHKNKQIQYEDAASRINTISSPQFVHLPGNAHVSLLVSVMLPSRGASPNKRTLIVCSWNSLQKGEVVWFNHVHFQYCSLIMDLKYCPSIDDIAFRPQFCCDEGNYKEHGVRVQVHPGMPPLLLKEKKANLSRYTAANMSFRSQAQSIGVVCNNLTKRIRHNIHFGGLIKIMIFW